MEIHYSGGAANSDPSACLGGARSSYRLTQDRQFKALWPPLPGVAILDYGLYQSAMLSYVAGDITLAIGGDPVFVGAGGVFTLAGDKGSRCKVQVTVPDLPGENTTRTLSSPQFFIQALFDVVPPAVDGARSDEGQVTYRCLYVRNSTAYLHQNVQIYADIGSGAEENGDVVYIGWEPREPGDGSTSAVASVLASQTQTPPETVSWVKTYQYVVDPELPGAYLRTITPLQALNLPAGQCLPLWVKRVRSGTSITLPSAGTAEYRLVVSSEEVQP